MFAMSVRLVRVGVEVLLPLGSVLSGLLLMLHYRTLLGGRHCLFLSIGLVNHVKLLNIYAFNIEFDCGSIWLFFSRFFDCGIPFQSLGLSTLSSSLRGSIRRSMIGFRPRTMSSECWSELVKLSIMVLEQQRTLLSSLWVLLFCRPKVLFSVIASFPYFLFMFTPRLSLHFTDSFCSCNRRSIPRP